jgi:hypothetical protein
VVEQMWALLPSYCDVPTDLVQVCQYIQWSWHLGFQPTVCGTFGQCCVSTSQFTGCCVPCIDKLDREEQPAVANGSRWYWDDAKISSHRRRSAAELQFNGLLFNKFPLNLIQCIQSDNPILPLANLGMY